LPLSSLGAPWLPFAAMAGLTFANTMVGARVIGNKINTGYAMPEGWGDAAPTDPTWKMGGSEARCDWAMVLLQPETSLDLKPARCSIRTYIQMFKKTEDLVEVIQTQTPQQLEKLMGLSAKTAKSHFDRFKQFHKLPPKQACLIFGGDRLGAVDFSDSDTKFCETHLRFVSGLYGVLRPYDDVKPVRDVPMGGALTTKRGATIAEFWGDALAKHIVKECQASKAAKPLLVIVLTSEYVRGLQLEELPKDIRAVCVEFEGASEKETIKARAMFGRYFVRKRVTHADELRDFEHEDWALEKFKSSSSKVVYIWVGGDAGGDKKSKKDKKDRDRGGSRSRSGSGRPAKKKRQASASSGEEPPARSSKQTSKKADRDRSRSPSQPRRKREKAERSPRREKSERSPPGRKRKARSYSS